MIGFWVVSAIAFLVRLAYLLQIRGTPLTGVLLIDSQTYDRFARLILSGHFRGEEVYSMNLLYPYFLAGIYAVAGAHPVAVLLVQTVLGGLNAGLVFALARRFFDTRVAWVAGLAAAFYGPYVFYTGTLLTPVVIETCTLLALLALAAWCGSPRAWLLAAAGLATGLAALGRGSALLFVPLAVVFFRVERGAWRAALGPWIGFAAAALLLPALATVRNAFVEGRFVPVSANYAAFYLGHDDGATGLYHMPDFIQGASYEEEVSGTREALSREMGRPLTQAEASNELLRRGVRWALAHPSREASLTARKLYYFWNRTESPTNANFHFARHFSWILRALPLGLGIVAPLGLAGMIAERRRWREHLLLHLSVLVPLVTCLAFFVSAEYRLPAVAALLLFAAGAVVRSVDGLRAWMTAPRTPRRGRERGKPHAGAPSLRDAWIAVALLPVFVVACNVRTPLLRLQSLTRVDFYDYGVLYKQRGNLEEARRLLERSLAIDPNYRPAHEAMADLENRLGDTEGALRHAALARAPGGTGPGAPGPGVTAEDRTRIAAQELYRTGRYAEALATFESARAAYLAAGDAASATSVTNNMGLALYHLGRLAEAESTFVGIVRTTPDYVRAHTNLGRVYEALDRPADAESCYRRALAIEPANRSALRGLERVTGMAK